MALPHPSLEDFNFSNQPSNIFKYTILACKLVNVKYEHRLHFNFSNQPSNIFKYTILACKLVNVKYEHRLHVYIPTCACWLM